MLTGFRSALLAFIVERLLKRETARAFNEALVLVETDGLTNPTYATIVEDEFDVLYAAADAATP